MFKNLLSHGYYPMWYNVLIGLCKILEGLVIVFTLGKVFPSYALSVAKWYVAKHIKKMEKLDEQ